MLRSNIFLLLIFSLQIKIPSAEVNKPEQVCQILHMKKKPNKLPTRFVVNRAKQWANVVPVRMGVETGSCTKRRIHSLISALKTQTSKGKANPSPRRDTSTITCTRRASLMLSGFEVLVKPALLPRDAQVPLPVPMAVLMDLTVGINPYPFIQRGKSIFFVLQLLPWQIWPGTSSLPAAVPPLPPRVTVTAQLHPSVPAFICELLWL